MGKMNIWIWYHLLSQQLNFFFPCHPCWCFVWFWHNVKEIPKQTTEIRTLCQFFYLYSDGPAWPQPNFSTWQICWAPNWEARGLLKKVFERYMRGKLSWVCNVKQKHIFDFSLKLWSLDHQPVNFFFMIQNFLCKLFWFKALFFITGIDHLNHRFAV